MTFAPGFCWLSGKYVTQLLQLKNCFIVYQLFSQGGLSYCVLQIFIFLNGIFLYFRMS